MPALASALRQAGVGPVSMMVGSRADHRAAHGCARAACRPARSPASSRAEQHQRRAVDDARRVARVVHVRDRSRPSCTCAARWRRSPSRPSRRTTAPAWPSPPAWRLARIVSSSASIGRPAMSCTGTTDFAKWPAARAAAARWCDRSAYASRSSREKPSSVAIRSALMPCGTKPMPLVDARIHEPRAAVRAHRPAAHALDAAGHDQCPRSRWLTLAAARFTASRPEAQKRICVTPARSRPSRRPAPRCARCRRPARRPA